MPIVQIDAENIGETFSFSPIFVKKDTVIGIMGNTQGVNNAKKPIPIANKINDENLKFLKTYTKFYIKKYIKFYEKANDLNYSYQNVNQHKCLL